METIIALIAGLSALVAATTGFLKQVHDMNDVKRRLDDCEKQLHRRRPRKRK